MKKAIYIISLVLACFLISCEDFLEAPSQSTLDESLIFSNPTLASMAVDGIKEPLGQTNSYRGRFIPFYGANTDIEWNNSSDGTGPTQELARYENSATNTYMNTTNNAWAMMYLGIERANICIRGLRTFGDPAPGNEMGQLLGEALTLRSIYYADLLKAWGDVVARFEPVSSTTIYLTKSSRDDLYKQVIADLGEAATLVGWPNETEATTSTERINRAFVKALRARLILRAAGYSQYPDGIRRSNDPELSVATLYPIALQECKDVINSHTAQLESTFEKVFRLMCEEDITAGGESLWEIPFAAGRGRVAFTYAVKHRSVDQYTGQPRGGTVGPLPFFFYDFDEKDTRRDVTCVPYQYGTAVNGVATQELRSLDSWCFGKWRYEWMDRYVTSTNDDGLNKIYLRYAEVLLMAAEIENELNGPGAAAPYLKQLRQRAFAQADWPVKVDAYVNSLASKEQMFDAIVDEFAFEFCGEMERKSALIRWNLLGAKMDEALVKMDNLRNMTGEYSDVPANLYYRYVADEDGQKTKLQIYGLNRGETADMSGEYPGFEEWVTTDAISENKRTSLFRNDPDSHQFWPIWQVFIDASNGMLTNDYGY
ncbi:MAG: RagB/SusD family nutrient uptake outer membrane protein [Bacteroidales bacterium]|nr:RagB/SusD family nutrient uptake outer membrane protein [Bacteroidales bacterium]MDT8373372.1 RagB/SusD family nutrient uptake outer membrane protein [Bacteroidales bacterium]